MQLQDWEVLQFMELIEIIYGFRDVGVGKDGLLWCGKTTGTFSVSSFYELLAGKNNDNFPWHSIWVRGGSNHGIVLCVVGDFGSSAYD